MCVGEYSKSKFDVLDGWSLGFFHTEIGCGVGFSPTMRLFGWSSIEIGNSRGRSSERWFSSDWTQPRWSTWSG